MSEIKLPFTEKIAKIIAIIVIVALFGGYALYFSAKGRFHAQGKELEKLKAEYAQVKETLGDIKTKYNAVSLDIKQMTDSVHDNLLKYQECQQKLNALEAKYESMRATTPSLDHPVKDLQKPAADLSSPPNADAQPATQPATTTPAS